MLALPRPRSHAILGLAAVFVIAVAIAAFVSRTLSGPTVAFDTAASVIHFDRIVSGRHLEGFVTTTPKPLMTAIFGPLHAIGGWTAVVVATIAAFGAAVTLATLLAYQLGGFAPAAFTATALVGSRLMLLEVMRAHAIPWALALWLIAAFAVLARPRRYGVAALALFLATLARLETIVIVPGLIVAIALARPGLPGGAPRELLWRAGLVALGPVLALPVYAIHDWLLTGDPLFWASVSSSFSTAAAERVTIPSLEVIFQSVIDRYGGGMPIFLLLATLACVRFARDREWPMLVGTLAFAVGNVAFLLGLAFRGIWVSTRYFAALDALLLVTAGIGLAEVRLPALAAAVRQRANAAVMALAMVLAGAIVAVAISRPWAPLDDGSRRAIEDEVRFRQTISVVLPTLRQAIDTLPGSRDLVAGATTWRAAPDPTTVVLFVPSLLRPQIAFDLQMPLSRTAGITIAGFGRPGSGFPRAGQLVYHNRREDAPRSRFTFLEVTEPTPYGDVELVPLLADERRGLWVIEVRARS